MDDDLCEICGDRVADYVCDSCWQHICSECAVWVEGSSTAYCYECGSPRGAAEAEKERP